MYRILYISTVGNNKAAVYRYVEKGYMITDQITKKEYIDYFKGGKK